ncbi:MAG: sigma-70 family RNA polymerase sigma factor [Ilumatobacteraceae bacterium]
MPPEPDESHDVMSPAGFASFYRAHLATVYGYISRLTGGDRSLAEDLTQDTFVALTRELKRGRAECADVRWLLTVARHRFIDHVRREASVERKLRLVAAGLTHESSPTQPSRAEVLDWLQLVDPLHRVVLMALYIDGSTVPEIADAIGRSTTATHSLLARAREQLRQRAGRSA